MPKILIAVFLVFFLISCSSRPAGMVEEVTGDVRIDGETVLPGKIVYFGQKISTGEGTLILDVTNAGILRIFEDSELNLTHKNLDTRAELENGRLWSVITRLKKDSSYTVKAPNAMVGVRGTEFIVETDSEESDVRVVSGEVDVSDKSGKKTRLGKGKKLKVLGRKLGTIQDYDPLFDKQEWQLRRDKLKNDGTDQLKKLEKKVKKNVKKLKQSKEYKKLKKKLKL